MVSLQHDTGKYAGEYTYSAQDGMFGWRGLYNFGWRGTPREVGDARGSGAEIVKSRVQAAQNAAAGQGQDGQKGRFSAGAEVYFSAKQRSFGSESNVAQSCYTSWS
jgi:distribution and morphology protein 10